MEWRAEVSLKSLLGLLKDRLSGSWRHSEDLNADVIFYDPASPLAQALLRRGDHGRRQVLVPCSATDPGPAGLALPIASARLMHCLEEALTQLVKHGAAPELERPHLCQRLDQLLQTADGIGVLVAVGQHRGVLDYAQRLVYWSCNLDADTLAQLILEEVELAPLRAGDNDVLQLMARNAEHSAPWDAILWAIGVGTSGGRLLQCLNPDQPYRLNRWPDFGLVGRRSTDIKCSAVLNRHTLSPQAVQARTGFPAAAVQSFFNACALCGYLEEVAPAEAPQPLQPGVGMVASGMLARIRKALSLGPG